MIIHGARGGGAADIALQASNATNMANVSAVNHAQIITRVGDWSITHDPATNTIATITRAAGGVGVRHVCTSIFAIVAAGTTNLALHKVYLRDGASGVGAILWSATLLGVNVAGKIEMSYLSIVGSDNAAMTLEFSIAPGAGNQENVSLTGYTVVA